MGKIMTILPLFELVGVTLVFMASRCRGFRPMFLAHFTALGQYREAIGFASHAASAVNELTSEVVKEEIGTFIRTAYNDGCLDAGCCIGFQSQVRYNTDCPSWGWLKWSFNGPMLVAHRPLIHSCLDCQYGERNCLITTASCTGKHTQFWYLAVSNNRKTDRGEMLFTIVNPMHPDRCITIDKMPDLHMPPYSEGDVRRSALTAATEPIQHKRVIIGDASSADDVGLGLFGLLSYP
ncbi:hypothetical protein BIW11_11517 [Tropilaelaps mercedesae]|uniref:Uncharacterized protein n=1 Tax=Tropilaelaps mercedesae TaxID=418985 RepID=A0A1V9XAR0_9ACAR|nr:hypothetical protein BIW11_11517 [Tropilaelaps mercedesae]